MSNKLIPKCCQECKQPICDEDGIIVHQYRHGNEMIESTEKCSILLEEINNE
jgi:hypothetical protein